MSFSIPQCYSSVEELRVRPVPGFSPIELFGENASLSAASDVYSVMALLYYSITGLVPPTATKRAVKDTMVLPAAVASTLSSKVIDCFVKSLSVYPQNRISTIDEVISLLSTISTPRNAASPAAPAAPAAEEAPAHETNPEAEAEYEDEIQDKPYYEEDESEENTPAKKSKSSSGSLITLAVSTFLGVVVACTVLFTVLYATFLYKSIDVPVLDNLLGSFSFLPMNEEVTDVYTPNYDTSTTISPEPTEKSYVTVPDFTSHTRDSIKTNETFNERFVIIYTEDYSDEVPKDAIIAQSLEKGESVLSGTEITVVVSLGAKPIELPNVIGMQYSKAEKELKDRGFTVKKEVMENKGGHKENEVYLMDKVAGLEFEKGTEIVLSVWGKEPETTTKETTTKKKEDTTKEKETTTKKQESSTKASDADNEN